MFYIGLSLLFFLISFFFFIKSKKGIVTRLIFGLLFFVVVFLYLFYYVSNYFTGEGINEAIFFHLSYGLEGTGMEGYELLAVSALLALVIDFIFFLVIVFNKSNNQARLVYSFLTIIFLIPTIAFNPAVIDIYNFKFIEKAEAVVESEKVEVTDVEIEKVEEIKEVHISSFERFYKIPEVEKIGKNKNVVFIYAEGFEETYSNEKNFPNLTPNLNKLKKKAVVFDNVGQTYGAGYTIAGTVSSQCGMPILSSIRGNSLDGMDEFLPKATCLGDILSDQGYYLSFMGGAKLSFAGKGNFYKTHGFQSVEGYHTFKASLKDKKYKTGWGIYDDTLFGLAFEKFEKLAKTKEQFGLFLLTLDTHHPNGHPSKSCDGLIYKDGKNKMLNAILCSDKIVSEFINKVQNSEYSKDTIIVLVSDHLGLKSTATSELEKYERTNRFMIFDQEFEKPEINNTYGVTLDIGSTVLPFLGLKTNIGFGRDLLDNKTSESEMRFMHSNVKFWEDEINELFDFPQLETDFGINIEDRVITMSNRNIKLPVLVEINKDLSTKLKFQFNLSDQQKLIKDIVKEDFDKQFVLVDYCSNVEKYMEIDKKDMEFCLVAGNGHKINLKLPLENNITIENDMLIRLTCFK